MQKEYQNLLADFISILKELLNGDLISIILFGSVARGTAKKASDIDLCLVIKNLPKSHFQRNKLLSPAIDALNEAPSYKKDGTWYWEFKPGIKLGEVITL